MIICFAIGNSDDKLPQAEWAAFLAETDQAMTDAVADGVHIHFSGQSAPAAPWQNALWAFEPPPGKPQVMMDLRGRLSGLARDFRQDSIAWWEARHTEMIQPAGAGR